MRTDIKVGDDVYVSTSLFISHGEDDFHGGLCKVTSVKPGISGGQPALFFTVAERAGWEMNWEIYATYQDHLKARYGEERGYMDPDEVSNYEDGGDDWGQWR